MRKEENEKAAIEVGGHKKTNNLHSKPFNSYKQADCEAEFQEAMRIAGVVCLDTILSDEEIHRFAPGGKGNKDGYYILFDMGGAFGDWSKGIHEKWSISAQGLSPSEKKKLNQQVERAKKAFQEETERKHLETAQQAKEEWAFFSETGKSQYLLNKQVDHFGVRFGNNKHGDFVAVPLRDAGGKLWNFQKISAKKSDGSNNKWPLTGGRKKGCFHVIGNIEDGTPLYVVEGYATGASVHMATGETVVVAIDAGNLDSVIAAIKKQHPLSPITIAGDDDCWEKIDGIYTGNLKSNGGTEGNKGREKAEEAANTHGCKVVFPQFQNTETKPTDFNDLHCLEGIETVQSQLQQALTEKAKPALPSGFSMKKSGLFHDDSWVCSPIEVLACTRDEHQDNWGRLVRFNDLDDYIHETAIPMEIMKGDCSDLFGLFLSSGLRIATLRGVRNKLADFLQSINIEKRALCTSRIGWHGKHFVLPNGSIPETDEIYLQSDNSNFVGFRSAGTLEEWQEHIAKPCQGNSRLVFSLSCAFAAPLLPLLTVESGGINLKGASSIGKSTALAVAASVWGSPKYVQQWKTTGNALEAVAEAHNHALLCLDELGQVDGKEAGEIAYMLANGSGKNRMKAKGGLRKKYDWNLLFLSTGEVSIADKIAEAGKKAHAGMLARMVDIPADANKGHRLFDTVHNFGDGNTLANNLKNSVARYYGTPIRAYLSQLAPIKDNLSECVERIKQDFFLRHVPANADAQVQRVAHRFVVVAAGGELAIKFGILPYAIGEAFEEVGTCFQAWLEERGGTKGYEGEEAIRQVKVFFVAHHSSRFASMGNTNSTEEKVINQIGYKEKTTRVNSDGSTEESWEFFVFPEMFRNEICKGLNNRMVLKVLAEKGFLLRGNDRQFLKEKYLPIGKKKIYHFTSSILTGTDE